MIKKYKMDFPAFTGIEKRDIYVYLPKSYKRSNKNYPVMYMFDGHNAFFDEDASYKRSWRLGKYLDHNNIDLIMVGVECYKGKHGERSSEYSPYHINFGNTKRKGYGDNTFEWIINVLKKDIDKKYRTLKDRKHTYLMGSSMGGIMTTYGILKYNRYFSKGCSLSPAYFIYPNKVYKTIKESKVKKDTVLYTDYGTKDLSVKKGIKAFDKANSLMIDKGINVTSRIIKDGIHHESSWEKQLPFAINTIMYE